MMMVMAVEESVAVARVGVDDATKHRVSSQLTCILIAVCPTYIVHYRLSWKVFLDIMSILLMSQLSTGPVETYLGCVNVKSRKMVCLECLASAV